jgi:hypothetical protein
LNSDTERLINIVKRLRYRIEFNDKIPFTHSGVTYYPERVIVIGIRNCDTDKAQYIGEGFINDKVIALILSHEVGHLINFKTFFSNMTFFEYDLKRYTKSEFKIKDEIYAWKTALNDILENLSAEELELAQEAINQYIYCEFIGTCTIESQIQLQQEIVDKISKVTQK